MLRALATIVILLGTIARASDLGKELAERMRSRSGTAVVVDVASGHVLAADHPEVAARRLGRPGSGFVS